MNEHEDLNGDGVADRATAEQAEHEHDAQGHSFCEDRADPSSWDDPDIAEPWEDPPEIEPADLTGGA